MLWANYPMTQVYQHEEDFDRGDHTISLLLGIRGTFYFVGGIFALVTISFVLYLNDFFGARYSGIFVAALAPVILFFSIWLFRILNNENLANYRNTMWLNFISATCLNAYFIYLFAHYSNVWQTL
jgi:hypothetical protein